MVTARSQSSLPYFVVEFVRAVSAFILGLLIALTPGHTAHFGLIAFGVYLVVSAVVVGASSLGLGQATPGRGLHVWQSLVALVVGALTLALNDAGIALLLWAIVLWALLSGSAEIVAGLRMPSGHPSRRDWIIQGSFAGILALIVLFQSSDSVAVIGFLGAWAIVQGVYGTISGLSNRWLFMENAKGTHA